MIKFNKYTILKLRANKTKLFKNCLKYKAKLYGVNHNDFKHFIVALMMVNTEKLWLMF